MPSTELPPIALRISFAADALSREPAWVDVAQWARLWATGLLQLADAAHAGIGPQRHLGDLMSRIDGEVPVEGLEAVLSAAMTLDSVEHYHELAVLALSQPLCDFIARTWVEARPLPVKKEQWWATFIDQLEREGPTDLRNAARHVDVTLRIGRDRLTAHPKPGLTPARLRKADGRVARTSRIALLGGGSIETGLEKLQRVNESLAANDRSHNRNVWELAQDLQARGRSMNARMRMLFAVAAKEIGFELDPAVGAEAMAVLLEALEKEPPPTGS